MKEQIFSKDYFQALIFGLFNGNILNQKLKNKFIKPKYNVY